MTTSEVLVFDFGGVLHSYLSSKDDYIQNELKKLKPLLRLLIHEHRLVILSNSNKKRILRLLQLAKIDSYFERIYGGHTLQSKVGRMKKIAKEYPNHPILLFDDSDFNIKDVRRAGFNAYKTFYFDLIQVIDNLRGKIDIY